jgi:hypothetical protein
MPGAGCPSRRNLRYDPFQANVIYLNAADPSQPHGYNPLRHVREDWIALAASGFLEVFKKMWPDAWGVRMEHILRNVLMALLERPTATMHDVLLVLSDREFRKELVKSIRNETVRTFFEKEFERYTFGYRSDGIAPIQNKVGARFLPIRCSTAFLPPRNPTSAFAAPWRRVKIDEIAFLDLKLNVLEVAATHVGVLEHSVAGKNIVVLIDVRPGV